MKILYAHLYDAHFKIGGAEKVLMDLAASMKKDYAAEVHVAVNPGDIQGFFEREQIPVTELAYSKAQTFYTLKQLGRVIADFGPDIIHSHHRYTTFLLDVFFKSKAPILHTEHVLRQDKKLFFRYGHRAGGVHRSVEENLKNYYGVPARAAFTIPNAVRVPPPRPEIMRRLKERFPREGKHYALFIGRFEEQKGHTYLVKAVSLLKKEERAKLKILLAGDGTLEAPIRAEIRALGVDNAFVFLGHTPEVPELLAFCDFLILPSLFEGMPLSILEAYAAGKAVIATDIPGSRELVRPGKTGLLAEVKNPQAFAEALAELINRPESIQTMSAAAGELSKKEYSYEVMMKRYHDVYEEMIGGFS